jgi:branched-chain amino acid transport system ATP-binding protein
VQSLLEQWNLWQKRHAPVRQLSYGEQRQLEILLALAHMPKVLLLDEPTAGLPAAETQQVVDMIQHLDPSMSIGKSVRPGKAGQRELEVARPS